MNNLGSFAEFGIDEATLARILGRALLRGGDAADLYFQRRRSLRFALEDGAVNRAFAGVELGVGVRVVIGDQVGYAYTEELSEEAMGRAAETAASVATSGRAGERPRAFSVPSRASYYKGRVEEASAAGCLPLLERLNQEALARDKRIKKVNISVGDAQDEILIARSDGKIAHDWQPMTSLGLCVRRRRKRASRNRIRLQWAALETYFFILTTLSASGAGEGSGRAHDQSCTKRRWPRRVKCPSSLPPARRVHLCSTKLSAYGMECVDFNRGRTRLIYADKIGKPIAKSLVSIVDDGTVEDARGAINVDDEGNASEKTLLGRPGRSSLLTCIDEISAKLLKWCA